MSGWAWAGGLVLSARVACKRHHTPRPTPTPPPFARDAEPPIVLNRPIHGYDRHMIGAIILGLVAGYVAKALVPGKDPGGFFVTIFLGLVGSLVGFFLFTSLLGIGDNDMFDLGGLVGAVIGTVLVLVGYRAVVGTGDRPATS